MPSTTSGFTGSEIVTLIQQYTGNYGSDFQSFISSILPLAEMRYCKAHDWRFLHKVNLKLPVVNGADVYDLSAIQDDSGNSYFMSAEDVESIFSPTYKIYFKKQTVQEMRISNPGHDSGNANDHARFFAPVGDSTIQLYPANFTAETLRLDGVIEAHNLFTLANYPIIPIRYQDSFIHYVFALALDRENDDRAGAKKDEAVKMITTDIMADVASVGDAADGPRMKHQNEAKVVPTGGDLAILFNNWAWNTP